MYWIIWSIFWVFQKIFMPTKIIGKENLIKGKAILCCNHQTNLDFMPIYLNVKTKIYTLGKEELFSNKIKSWFFKVVHVIPINRKKPAISSFKRSLEVLKNNWNLLIFPSGTRTESEELNNIKDGVGMFSLKSKAPIIPMVYLKKNRIFRRNTLVIGKPICVDDLEYSKENIEMLVNKLEENMNDLLHNYSTKEKGKWS